MREKITVPPNQQSILLKPSCLIGRGFHKQTGRMLLTQTHKCDYHNVKLTWGINKPMIRSLLSLDLDGTILKHAQTISKPVIDVLYQLQNDYRLSIMINTGRYIEDAIKVMESNNLKLSGIHSFSSGGLLSYRLGIFYRYKPIPLDYVKVLEAARDGGKKFIFFGDSIIKFSYLGVPEKEALELRSHLQGLFKDTLNIEMTPMADRNDSEWDSTTWAIDITSFGINKGWAVREVASLYNVQKENIIAVGDAHNDIPAYQESELAINLGMPMDIDLWTHDGNDKLVVIPKTVEEDGFLEAVESYIIPFLEQRK